MFSRINAKMPSRFTLNFGAYAKDFSRPGKPTDNGFIDTFNSKLRAESRNAHWLMSLADARETLEHWLSHCNEVRPHSATGYKVPNAIDNPGGATSPSP